MRKRYKRYTPEEITIVRDMAISGRTQREAAKVLECAPSSISELARLHDIQFNGRSEDKNAAFIPPVTTPYARRMKRLSLWKVRKGYKFKECGGDA